MDRLCSRVSRVHRSFPEVDTQWVRAKISPLFLFNSKGDCLAAKLWPGNVHSAEGWEELLLPEIEHQLQKGKEVAFQGDAAFAKPEIYQVLEERRVKCAIRLPANENLERHIEELLRRPAGRPSLQQRLVKTGGRLVKHAR